MDEMRAAEFVGRADINKRQLMRFGTLALIFLTLLLACLSNRESKAVTYRLEFEGTWSAATHPGAYPGGSAHFTALAGGTHNDSISFWGAGQLATPGIERVAEVGSTTTLRNEVQAAINSGDADSVLLGPSLFGLPNSTSMTIPVEASHPLVTLVTMVAPSPDWFVGVSGLPLRENDQWLGRVEVDLFAYDAGTEDGNGFSLSNPATSPQETIQKITSGPLAGLPPLGKFTFTLQPNELAGDFNLDGRVDDGDFGIWEAGYGDYSDGSATIVDGDANADRHVNGGDFLLWQQNYGQSLGPIPRIAVPEPRSTALLLVGLTILGTTNFHRRYAAASVW